MKYLLDTNACIVFLKNPNSKIRQKFKTISFNEIAVCSIVKAELFYGAKKSQKVLENLAKQKQFLSYFICLPFEDKAAEIYGDIRANLEKKGTPIGAYDLQIAAIAIANNLILITHNVGEFSRIDNLLYEDWE